ncbi:MULTISPECIES: hypothetical protein [Nostocaceae]|uniref:hypothetical protein n=1 Tax=Nostocaceae TaxID=1162 RepID=UPI0037BF5BF9
MPCSESFTSTLCVDNQQLQKFKVGDRVVWRNAPNAIYEVATPEKGGHVIIKLLECSTKPLPFARKRVPLWEISFIECTQQLQENNQSLDNLIGDRQESNLAEKNLSQPTPENFLEENECTSFPAQQAKPSKQKGCLYKYLENKKLKSGDIVSYPRVIGHRDIDNPNHWRWGFNWEEKVSGEWKGRSIGSIPVGAIPMIQSMQKEGVPLEEIIGFIKRAKAKFNQHN